MHKGFAPFLVGVIYLFGAGAVLFRGFSGVVYVVHTVCRHGFRHGKLELCQLEEFRLKKVES